MERIASDGIDDVRIARIAMDAGVSTSLVHYHFETREALLEQALDYSFELAGDVRIGEGEGDAPDHTRRLAAMVDQCLPYPGMLERDWILWVELWLRAVRHPELRPTAARLYARMRTWFADAIAAGIAAGRVSHRRAPERHRRPRARDVRRLRRSRAAHGALDRAGAHRGLDLPGAGARGRAPSRVSPDLVVVGAGTVGGWAGWFASRIGARVTVLERHTAGQGASSRAAGIVRAQGGTPTAVALGRWSIDFYERQQSLIGTDSGFRRLGYLLLARTDAEASEAKARVEMQRAEGLDVRWVSPDEAAALNPTLSPDGFVGATYCAAEGCIDPPRNVRAYVWRCSRPAWSCASAATARSCSWRTGAWWASAPAGDTIACSRVILTGGPSLRDTARRLGFTVFAGGARHQVAVTSPHEAFAGAPLPMVFDVTAGVYWRQEEDGLLFGGATRRSAPARRARELRLPRVGARRLAAAVPATAGLGLRKVWAATIDYTPDHLPILASPVEGLVIASAAGHGMMWGPAVARAAAQLALTGSTDVVDVSELGLDRFDRQGRSRLATDPIALPFPEETEARRAGLRGGVGGGWAYAPHGGIRPRTPLRAALKRPRASARRPPRARRRACRRSGRTPPARPRAAGRSARRDRRGRRRGR